MFNLFSFSKIVCSLKTNSLIGEWQGLTGRDELLYSCSTVNTLEKNLPNFSALSLFELTVTELPFKLPFAYTRLATIIVHVCWDRSFLCIQQTLSQSLLCSLVIQYFWWGPHLLHPSAPLGYATVLKIDVVHGDIRFWFFLFVCNRFLFVSFLFAIFVVVVSVFVNENDTGYNDGMHKRWSYSNQEAVPVAVLGMG